MKILKKILIALLISVVLIFVAGGIFIRHLSHEAIPDYQTDIKLKGITGEVTVYRDTYAVPHVFAKNNNDLYHAVGYIMAQDRLWQMDLLRRITTGRLSVIFGSDMINADVLFRSLRITEKSEQMIRQISSEQKDALQAYADGVNQFMEQNGDKLPLEFSLLGYKPEKWEIVHTVNIVGYMGWNLASASWNAETMIYKLSEKFDEEKYKALVPNVLRQKIHVYPSYKADSTETEIHSQLIEQSSIIEQLGLTVFNASNSWAVSGKKSATGKPLLANDMHLGYMSPGIWYQMHQVVENGLNVTGVTVPGAPLIIAGHNDKIAWGMTNLYVDDMDFYIETVNPENPDEYKFNGEWKKMAVKNEIIKTGKEDSVIRKLRFTHRGPVVSDQRKVNNKVVSMRWIGNEYSNEINAVYQLNRASDWEQFKNAISNFKAISQNFIYADVDGNIGLCAGGGVPIREGNAFSLLPGETDEYDWKGTVPFKELPYSYNPPEGCVSSANNNTVDTSYQYYIGSLFSQPYRINRIREMLDEKEKCTIDDFKKMQTDIKSKLSEILEEIIVNEIDEKQLNETGKQVLNMIKKWDCRMDKNMVAPTISDMFYLKLLENILKDEMGEELYTDYKKNKALINNFASYLFENKKTTWCDDVTTPDKQETFTDAVQKSFTDVLEYLTENHGDNPDNWKWRNINLFTIEHPMGKVKILDFIFSLNRGKYDPGGSFHTVMPYAYSFTAPFKVVHGASHRHIYSCGNWDESQTVIPTGTSGVSASEHYCDQTTMYLNNEYHSDFVKRELIEKRAKYTMKILPE